MNLLNCTAIFILSISTCFSQFNFQGGTLASIGMPANEQIQLMVDLNDDNQDDFITINSNSMVKFYRNNGNSTFSNINVGISRNISNCAITNADFNNDGLQDLVFIYSDSIAFYINSASGNFSDITSQLGITNPSTRKFLLEASTGTWDDYDNDGDLDLIFSSKSQTNSYIEVYVNNLTSFNQTTLITYALPITPKTITIDYDNDQDQDLLVLYFNNSNPPLSQYNYFNLKLYNKNGTSYSDVTASTGLNLGSNHGYAQIWDYNNDGFADIIMGSTDNVFNSSHVNRVYKNNGNGTFADVSTSLNLKTTNNYYRSIQTHDFDNDGDVEALYSSINVFFNNLGGSFSSNISTASGIPNESVGSFPRIIDINNDGKLDIVWSNCLPYVNNSITGNYVKLKLQGCPSAKDPRGTRVALFKGTTKQTRYLTGGGYDWGMNSFSNILHFGIGTNTSVDSIKVYWPNGGVSTLTQISINSLNFINQTTSNVNAGNDIIICAGSSVQLNGSGAATYSWNNGVTNGVSFAPTTSNTYTLTGTSAAGCVSSDQVIVTVNPLPTVNAGTDQTICAGANIVLAGSGAATYLWNNGITNGVAFTPVATNTYTLTGTNANGCVASDQVVVTVNPLPTVNAGADQSICSGANIVLVGSGAATYLWNNGITNGVVFTPLATNTYTLTGTSASGCVATDQVIVTVNPLPTVNAGADQLICSGANSILSGSGASTYSWNNGITNGVAFTPITTNTYTLTGTSANGCVASDQVLVTVNPLPTVIAGADQTICEGVNIVLAGSGAATYLWNNGITNGVAFTPVATNTYTLTGTSASGCVASDQVVVTVNPLPNVNAGEDQTICAGVNIVLNGSGASAFSWDNGVNDGVPFAPVSSTTFTLIGTDQNGCANSDQVIVIVNQTPSIDAGLDQTICEGTDVILYGSGGTTYSWSNAITNGVSFVPAITNTYTVTGTDQSGCFNTDQVTVIVNENGFVTIDETAMDSYTLNGQTYTQSGTYTQVIPTVGGCDSTITLNLTLSYTGIDEISNGISMYPNPTSEVLHLDGLKGEHLNFIVYDAAGRLVLSGILVDEMIDVWSLQPGTYTLKIVDISIPLRFVKE